jgi:hypothetical protein
MPGDPKSNIQKKNWWIEKLKKLKQVYDFINTLWNTAAVTNTSEFRIYWTGIKISKIYAF